MPPEKRLALNQVPLQGGGGGGSQTLDERTAQNTSGVPTLPVAAAYEPVPSTQIAFTLDVDQVVYFSCYATDEKDGAGRHNAALALRVDATDYPGTYTDTNGFGFTHRGALLVTRAIALTAGAHTAEVRVKRLNVLFSGGVVNDVDGPTSITAIFMQPIAVVASLIRQEAISQAGGIFATNSLTFLPIPNTQVTVDLAQPQTILFLGMATKARFLFYGDQLGIRVTSPGPTVIDFPGTRVEGSNFLNGFDASLNVHRAISLGAGVHTAELVLRSTAAFNSARVRTDVIVPAVMTALFTNPEEIVKITSVPPEVVNAGDTSAVGLIIEAARADHEHGVATDDPVDTKKANAEGVSTSLARADHEHRTIVEVELNGGLVGSRPIINFIGAVVADDVGNDRVNVTTNPLGTLTVVTPPILAVSQNNYDPGNGAVVTMARLSSSVAVDVTGFLLFGGNSDGHPLSVVNVGSFAIVLKNLDGLSAAGNQIITGTGGDLTLLPGDGLDMWYDGTSTKFRVR